MKSIYQVAGHRFAVVMPDNHLAWNEMKPYEPFMVENDDDLVFTVEMVDMMPDTSDKQKVTVSCEAPDAARVELYEWQGQWLLEMAPLLEAPVRVSLITDKAFTKGVFRVLGSMRFSIGTVLMLMFAFSTAQKNTLLMHSSVTVKDGKAYLFLGKSGTGKSTHSQLWINNIEGCELLNDDNPVLRVESAGRRCWKHTSPYMCHIRVTVSSRRWQMDFMPPLRRLWVWYLAILWIVCLMPMRRGCAIIP